MRAIALLVLLAGVAQAGAQQSSELSVPAWAFPNTSPPYRAARPPFDSVTPLRVPNSAQTFTLAQIRNSYGVPDWFPDSHPTMPEPVARGRNKKYPACGYCHLADGQGRSENAALAGLSADYIVRQVQDIRHRSRAEAQAAWGFGKRMQEIADSVSDEDLAIAAKYFASVRPKARVKVLERDTIQHVYQASGLYALHPEGEREPLGKRIVELPEDLERFELRDPQVGFIAYVPTGSVARGRAIANATGAKAARACVTCHGVELQGKDAAPLIAGRSPAYVFRQLLAFKTGARNTSTSGPMRDVVAAMSEDDMIAVVAYVGTRRPR